MLLVISTYRFGREPGFNHKIEKNIKESNS